MATIDDIARSLGKNVGEVGMLDLMRAGMSGTDAMQAVSEAAMRVQPTKYPPGFRAPDVINNPTPAASRLGLDTLGQALLDASIKPSQSLMDHLQNLLGRSQVSIPEKDWATQVKTQKAPQYQANPPTTPALPTGPVVTPPVQAPALGTGALVAVGGGLLLLLLFMGRR